MAWKKVPPEHAEAFRKAMPQGPGVELKKMFGCPAAFVNGNMFAGCHEETMLVRVGKNARPAMLKKPGFGEFTVRGRTMGEYVTLPTDKLTDTVYVRRWLLKGYEYASTLPPKEATEGPSRGG